MIKEKNPVINETLWLLVGILICFCLEMGVYALAGYFSTSVLVGGAVGSLLTVGNFFFMAMGLYNMTSGSEESKARARAQGSFVLRMAVLFGLLVVAVKLLHGDALATVIPLLCERPVIMIRQFLLKSENKTTEEEQNES